MIRYHLDEHVDGAIARGLRDRGVDVTTARDAGLLGAPDAEHLEFAMRESRVIVTHDADFLRLARETECASVGATHFSPNRRKEILATSAAYRIEMGGTIPTARPTCVEERRAGIEPRTAGLV